MKKLKFSLAPDLGTLSERDAKRYFSVVGLAAFGWVIGLYAGSLLLSGVLAKVAPTAWEHPLFGELLSLIPLYGIAFPILYLILRLLPRDRVQPDKMGAGNWWMGLCVAFLLMMAGNYVGNILIAVFEGATGRSLTNPVEASTVGRAWWINLLFVAVLAPIVEELVFRKLLCERLLPLGEGYAVVLSAALFALVHRNFFQVFYAFLLGALFAVVYIKTGRLRYSVFYHMVINLLGGVFAPWVLEKLGPLMEEETIAHLMEALEAGNVQALSEMLSEYLLPLLLLLGYEALIMIAAVCGIVFLIIGRKKLRFEQGLLPPPKEGRVANVFCNVGVAAAVTVFAIDFVLSLL